jgi:hypothetical protein
VDEAEVVLAGWDEDGEASAGDGFG